MWGKQWTIVVVLGLFAAACGGEGGEPAPSDASSTTVIARSGTDTSQSTTVDQNSVDQNSQDSPATAAGGTIVVDGETFPVSEMYRCEPYDGPGADPQPEDLDLVAFGSDSRYLSLTLGHDEAVNMNNGVRYPRQIFDLRLDVVEADGQVEYESGASNDEDGDWFLADLDQTPLDGAPFTIDGDHIAGEMTVVEVYPNEGNGTVNVAFDLEIPGNIQDCSA
jgi:hypothetical protein